jgi:hypothetical protein
VHQLKAIVGLLLVATWLPTALPCGLKVVLFPALDCCPAENSQPGEKTDCHHCQICGTVAAGSYAASEMRVIFSKISAPIVQIEAEPGKLLPTASFATRSVAPPDLPASWRFALRAACPVRAPSFSA